MQKLIPKRNYCLHKIDIETCILYVTQKRLDNVIYSTLSALICPYKLKHASIHSLGLCLCPACSMCCRGFTVRALQECVMILVNIVIRISQSDVPLLVLSHHAMLQCTVQVHTVLCFNMQCKHSASKTKVEEDLTCS